MAPSSLTVRRRTILPSHSLPRNSSYFVERLKTLAQAIRDSVAGRIRTTPAEHLAQAVEDRGGDTIFRLDLDSEEILLNFCEDWSQELPFTIVAEGLEHDHIYPRNADPENLAFTLIVDPVDGTRELMYGKRSAWALFGVAPPARQGWRPGLNDIRVALQAELPTARAALADILWAARGEGVEAETHNLLTGEVTSFVPRPSRAATIEGGFAAISKFFPGAKAAAAELEERLFLELLGPPTSASPQVFDDEYISSGGQLYELTVGHDRFLADLRPLLHAPNKAQARLCCHPYDLCSWIIAEEAGVIVTDERGDVLSAPLDTTTSVAWAGYANRELRSSIEPILQKLLAARSPETGAP